MAEVLKEVNAHFLSSMNENPTCGGYIIITLLIHFRNNIYKLREIKTRVRIALQKVMIQKQGRNVYIVYDVITIII